MLRVGETVFPRNKPCNWLSNTWWSALKSYIQVTLNKWSRLNYVCSVIILTSCAHTQTIKKEVRERKGRYKRG